MLYRFRNCRLQIHVLCFYSNDVVHFQYYYWRNLSDTLEQSIILQLQQTLNLYLTSRKEQDRDNGFRVNKYSYKDEHVSKMEFSLTVTLFANENSFAL